MGKLEVGYREVGGENNFLVFFRGLRNVWGFGGVFELFFFGEFLRVMIGG